MKDKSKKIIDNLLFKYEKLNLIRNEILQAANSIVSLYKNQGKMLVCGNGGSAADCEHIVGELMKGFCNKRELSEGMKNKIGNPYIYNNLQYGLPAISLVSQTSLYTAFSNDQAPDLCFAQQVLGYGKKGDILLAISTSGNSKNCVYASQVAKAMDMTVISLTGQSNSLLSEVSDICIKVPSKVTFEIQEYHLPIYHALCLFVENELFGVENE